MLRYPDEWIVFHRERCVSIHLLLCSCASSRTGGLTMIMIEGVVDSTRLDSTRPGRGRRRRAREGRRRRRAAREKRATTVVVVVVVV